jgi:hypothetical protein
MALFTKIRFGDGLSVVDDGGGQITVAAGGMAAGWVPAFRQGHTWALGGLLTAGLNVPQIFVPKTAGQAATLVAARALLGSGTSIGAQLQRNGSNLGSLITVTTTAATTAFSQALADMDTLDLVLSAATGSPTDLSFTLVLEHQL